MKPILVFAFLCLVSATVHARNAEHTLVPFATDYDLSPEKIFTPENTRDFFANTQWSIEPLSNPVSFKAPNSSPYSLAKSTTVFVNENSKVMDWQAVQAMNLQAAQTWSALLACTGGDKAARASLLQRKLSRKCGEALTQLQNLYQTAGSFLASSMIDELNIDQFSCDLSRLNDYRAQFCLTGTSIPYQHAFDYKVLFGFNPKKLRTHLREAQLVSFNESIASAQNHRLHPLFVQVILEFIASGYPLNYGTRTSPGIAVFLPRYKMILESDQISWNWQGHYTQSNEDSLARTEIYKWVESILSNNELPMAKGFPNSASNPPYFTKLQLLRQAKLGVRLLNHLSLGNLNCEDWGLWPSASVRMLGFIAQSEYSALKGRYESTDLDVLAMRLSLSCQVEIPDVMLVPGSMESTKRSSNLDGPTALAEIGAWRTLLRQRLENSGSNL